MDLLTEMDMKMSKGNFPYFFENVLGYDLADFHQEWLDLVNSTQRTVIICSRDHGKSVFFHAWAVYQLIFQEPPYQMLYISSNQKADNGSHERYRPYVHKYSSIEKI